MDSSIFVLDPIKGEFWHFKVERRVLTSGTVLYYICRDISLQMQYTTLHMQYTMQQMQFHQDSLYCLIKSHKETIYC